MNRFTGFIIVLLLALKPAFVLAQHADTLGVVIHADERLAILTESKKHGAAHRGGIRSGRGYRVQIYSGGDRQKATQIKIDFIRRFPSVRSYISYISPTYRVKVGNFRSRGEAEEFARQARAYYSPCTVVPDIIEFNTLRRD